MDIRRRRQTIVPSESAVQADGDFVQLRIIRERRKQEIEQQKLAAPLSLPTVRESNLETKEKSKLLTMLFDAIEEHDVQTAEETLTKLKNHFPIQDIRHPKRNENVLHAALSTGLNAFAKKLITNEHETLVTSCHEVRYAGIVGNRNCMHIAIEKSDLEMAKLIMNKIRRIWQKQSLLKQETAVNITDQRPRLFSCLHLAAYYGHVDLVKFILDEGMDVNHLNGKNDTALLWAARWGHKNTVDLLLERKANPEVANDKGSTALYWAIRYEHPKTVALLLSKGRANPNTQRKLGLVAPIIIASAFGNVEILQLLLQQPTIDVNLQIRGGDTAIHNAAREGNLDCVKILIEKGVKFDEKDSLGDTPLLLAAKNDFVHVVNYLVLKGANVNAKNNDGKDIWYFSIENEGSFLLQSLIKGMKSYSSDANSKHPLLIAADKGRCDKIKLLLDMNVDPAVFDADGNDLFHHSAMEDKPEVIETFANVFSLQNQNKLGNTPLHIACLNGHSRTIMTLLKFDVKANVKNKKGEMAIHVAAYSPKTTPELARELVSYMIKNHDWNSLNDKDLKGQTCLHIACRHTTTDVLWEFREVKLNERDPDGLTPLHVAVRPKQPDILETVLDMFERNKRDLSINEQTISSGETVLHLAAQEGHSTSIPRLIKLGADIAVRDVNGDTVLHKLIKLSVFDVTNNSKYIESFTIILSNIVRWWCLKSGTAIPENEHDSDYIVIQRTAFRFIIYDVHNIDGLSVLKQAFQCGATKIVGELLMVEQVTFFETDGYTFDVSYLTPRTNEVEKVKSHSVAQVSPTDQEFGTTKQLKTTDKYLDENQLSAMELLIESKAMSQAADILDLPLIREIERYYMRIVSWVFSVLMVLHMIYMSVFTYIGVELSKQMRTKRDYIGSSDAIILMYVIVPIEPAIIVIFMLFRFIKSIKSCSFYHQAKIQNQERVSSVLILLSSFVLPALCIVYSGLIFAWMGMLSKQRDDHNYILATALCIGWLLTISFTRGIRPVHYFYRMLLSMIARDMVRFVLVYLFVLMAFGFAFHVIIQVSEDATKKYYDPGVTLFTTFNMMIGMGELIDEDYESQMMAEDRSIAFSKVLYLIYIILSTIILLNLLIAMMNDSYSRILQNNKIYYRIESIKLGIQIESSIPCISRFSDVNLTKGSAHVGMTGLNERWLLTISNVNFERYVQDNIRMGNMDDVSNRLDNLSDLIRQTNDRVKTLAATIDNIEKSKLERKVVRMLKRKKET